MVAKDIIAFTRGVPPAKSFPREELITCAERVILADSARILQYGTGAGYRPLREYIASQHQVSTDRILVGQGSLQLLDHLCRVMLKQGDSVFIEQPTYDRTITLFRRAGAKLVGFHLHLGQMDLDKIQSALEKGPVPRIFYVIPDFQNPAGSTMSLDMRKDLIRLSNHYGFIIIEDSPYRQLRYTGDPLPALFDLAPDRVIYMSSFSKLISPGLRTGYMVLREEMADAVIRFATDTYISPSMFDQAVVREFLNMGLLSDHLHHLKRIFYPRLQTLLDAMQNHLSPLGVWTKPQGGYFVGFFMNEELKPPSINQADQFGLALSHGEDFFIQPHYHFLRLPFCALSQDQIEAGIHRLKELLLK